MNLVMFFLHKLNEDPQDFLIEVYKILYAMKVSFNVKEELASYKLKDVVQTWHTQCRYNRALRESPITLEGV